MRRRREQMHHQNNQQQNADYSYKPATTHSEEIEIRKLIAAVWAGKYWIGTVTGLVAIASIVVVSLLPDVYRSEALLVAVAPNEGGAISSIASQYSGLAAIAGIDLNGGGGVDRVEEGLAILKSRKFIGEFVENHELIVPLMAVDHWDKRTGELIIDRKIYDPESGRWIREVGSVASPSPSMQEAYWVFMEHMRVTHDKATNFVTLSIEHSSPALAQLWVTWLVEDLNKVIKTKDVENAERSIAYLREQLGKTAVADLQSIFYQLIEGQMKTIMLANGRGEYLFKTLDPAISPEIPVRPKRIVIVLVCIAIGFILSLFISVLYELYRQEEESE